MKYLCKLTGHATIWKYYNTDSWFVCRCRMMDNVRRSVGWGR